MAENEHGVKDEKSTRARRRPEHEALLIPTFTVAHETGGSERLPGFLSTPTEDDPGAVEQASADRSLSAGPALLQPDLIVNEPGDLYEQEADRVADAVMQSPETSSLPGGASSQGVPPFTPSLPPTISRVPTPGSARTPTAPADLGARVGQMQGGGDTLPEAERQFFEARMGFDFSQVRVHTDANAVQASRDVGAQAFTSGQHIAFNQGMYQPGTPGGRRLLAHELTHVLQQTGTAQRKAIQRTIDPTYALTNGTFNVTATTGGSNLPITIRFHPAVTAPYSNQIGLIQIVKLTDTSGANIEPQSLSAASGASLRTTANAATGVEAGYFTDVLHNTAPAHGGTGTNTPQGSPLPPQYPFGNEPAPTGPATPGLSRPTSSGAGPATIGYKRSNNPADIKDAEITDAPGYGSIDPANADINFDFETVAKGEDTMTIFGALKWGVEIRGSKTTNEHASADDSQSATFEAALEKHRDFYVHEPVIFYFDFDSRELSAGEASKIDTFLEYLRRFTDVKVTPTGYADQKGGNSQYNMDLSLDRASAVAAALRDKGVPETQISGVTIGAGATEAFTPDATTSQAREANRRGNRRVVLTFAHVPGSGTGAAAAGAAAGGATP